MSHPKDAERVPRWYFGGLAGACAVVFTHPLDTIKVHLQTHQGKISVAKVTMKVINEHGFFALYNGLTASVLRQLTYSTTRFGIYGAAKQAMDHKPSFATSIGLAAVSGAAGGFVGTPADMVNVRMQNDMKLPPDKRRNYKHALDGLIRVGRDEGVLRMFNGGAIASMRAAVMTMGQLSIYDLAKNYLLSTPHFHDDDRTHFLASLFAGACATGMTQPMDVIKTRVMNAKPGEFKNLMHVITTTAKLGPVGFFKGFIPSFVRIGPTTILTFIFLEHLTEYFGYVPKAS